MIMVVHSTRWSGWRHTKEIIASSMRIILVNASVCYACNHPKWKSCPDVPEHETNKWSNCNVWATRRNQKETKQNHQYLFYKQNPVYVLYFWIVFSIQRGHIQNCFIRYANISGSMSFQLPRYPPHHLKFPTPIIQNNVHLQGQGHKPKR